MRFQCPKCREIVAVDNAEAGKNVQCGHCQQAVPVPPTRTSPGAVIADFIINKELGRGGMGIVYLSHQISLDRSAALKVLAETFVNNSEFVVGFIKEARAAAKLNHPHIVQAYAVGEDDGLYYFAMENVDGKTMKAVLAEKKIIPNDEAIQIIQQIAEALDYAWKEQRLIHRDIKPDNIMLTSNGKAKLADLGLARVAGEKDEHEHSDEVMGTPQYISPEALLGEPMDIRSDIYSLGATFYQFVTGQFPFNGNSATEIAKKHITDPLVPPIQIVPSMQQSISDVIVKMMEKDPNRRYQDAELLVEDLRNIRKNKVVSGKIPRLKIPTTSSVSLQKLAGLSPIVQPPAAPASAVPVLKMSGAPKAPAAAPVTVPVVPAPAGAPPGLKMPSKPEPPKVEEKPASTETKNGGIAKDKGKASKQVKTMKQEREKKAVTKVIGSLILVLVILAASGIGAWVGLGNGKAVLMEFFSKMRGKVATAVEIAKEPDSTPLIVEADKIIAASEKADAQPETILTACENFFQQFKEAKYTKEKPKYAEIQQIFDRVDEQLADPKREELRARYLAKLEDEKEAARKRAEDDARRARERREREEREREQRRLADIRAREEAKELNELKQKTVPGIPRARVQVIEKFMERDYNGAKAVLDDVIDVRKSAAGKFSAYRNEANRYANWGRTMLNYLNRAERFRSHLRNGGKELNRPQLVHMGRFGAVVSIKDGLITADQGGGKAFTLRLVDLSHAQFMAFLSRLINKMNNKDDAYCYLMLKGDFEGAETIAKEFGIGNGYRKELTDSAIEYIKQKYRSGNADQKSQLEKKYGKLDVFKRATGRR